MIFSSILKFLINYFFIWFLPIATLFINDFKGKELFEVNILLALAVGILINTLWEYIQIYLKRKEYHKNFL